jgi:hypothetical protein
MSDEVWKRQACSGIPKNVGGSLKREHVAAFDVCQGSPLPISQSRNWNNRGKLSTNWGARFLMKISLIVHHLGRQARNRFSVHLAEMATLRLGELDL